MVDNSGERVDDMGASASGQHGRSVGLGRSVGHSTDTEQTRRLGGSAARWRKRLVCRQPTIHLAADCLAAPASGDVGPGKSSCGGKVIKGVTPEAKINC